MMKIIFLFLLLLISMMVGAQLSHDPGHVMITVNHWTIQTTLTVALIILLVSFCFLHYLFVSLKQIGKIGGRLHHWKAVRRTQKAHAITTRGLIEFSEGYWSEAKDHLIKALPDTDTPLLNYLTAARAAQELGDNKLRDDYLREAQQSMPDAKIAVELTQAQLQLANQQWEQALATLRHLQDLAPHHPYVLKLLMHLYQEVRDWPQLIALLPEIKKQQIITDAHFEKLRHHAYLQAMKDLARLSQTDAITNLVNALPKPLKYDPELMSCFCRYLMDHDQKAQAESILMRCLKNQYHEKLIALYGEIYCNDKQLRFAESLLKKYPNSSALFLCLGRLSVAEELWGKAKNYLEKSIALRPSPEAYQEMGKLHQRFGETEKACLVYQEALACIRTKS